MNKATKQAPPVQFRGADLDQHFSCRGEAGNVAKRDLRRYYRLMQLELSRVRFTEAEALLMCETAALVEGEIGDGFWANLADQAAAAERRHVNLDALAAKLRAPSLRQAVADAIEQFWRLPADIDQTERLARVGLVSRHVVELKEAAVQLIAAHRAMRIAEAKGENVEAARWAFARAEKRVSNAEEAVESDMAAHGRKTGS